MNSAPFSKERLLLDQSEHHRPQTFPKECGVRGTCSSVPLAAMATRTAKSTRLKHRPPLPTLLSAMGVPEQEAPAWLQIPRI